MQDASLGFPATLEIDYPDRRLNRLTTALRLVTSIPILIILASVSGPAWRAESAKYVVESGGIVVLATMLMLLFRLKYPRWWFDWNLALTRFSTTVEIGRNGTRPLPDTPTGSPGVREVIQQT